MGMLAEVAGIILFLVAIVFCDCRTIDTYPRHTEGVSIVLCIVCVVIDACCDMYLLTSHMS